jgi:glyoxylase-like metal-dependent hydrolase (beta-lactamase superfamily II)
VPNYLPGKNPFVHEFADKFHIPAEAALGGAETMYPEYRLRLKSATATPVASSAPIAPTQQTQSRGDGELQLLPVQGNVYLLAGAGGNIVIQTGEQGTLVVDTGSAGMSDKILAALGKLTPKLIQYIIDTSADSDHAGGNAELRKAGTTYTGANVAGDLKDAALGAQVFAHDNVLQRMSAPTGKQSPVDPGGWPTLTFVEERKQMSFNGEPVEMIHLPGAHTDGDSIVFFRRSDVIAAGDILLTTSYPHIDLERGGSIQGEIDALNTLFHCARKKAART